jgi:hypothetical protein
MVISSATRRTVDLFVTQQLRCASRRARAAVGLSRSQHQFARDVPEAIGPTNVISSLETLLADSLVVECPNYDVIGRRLALPSVLAGVIGPRIAHGECASYLVCSPVVFRLRNASF